MSKQGIAIKGSMDYASVVAFLEDVVRSFKEKKVCVQRGEEFVTLTPGESIDLEVEAAQKKGKQKLCIELTWREELSVESDMPFKVSACEPEPKPVEEVMEEARQEKDEALDKATDHVSTTATAGETIEQAKEGLGTAKPQKTGAKPGGKK
jgi:amphi-Trp domain-containing protein